MTRLQNDFSPIQKWTIFLEFMIGETVVTRQATQQALEK